MFFNIWYKVNCGYARLYVEIGEYIFGRSISTKANTLTLDIEPLPLLKRCGITSTNLNTIDCSLANIFLNEFILLPVRSLPGRIENIAGRLFISRQTRPALVHAFSMSENQNSLKSWSAKHTLKSYLFTRYRKECKASRQ